jgi:hypothetical protein
MPANSRQAFLLPETQRAPLQPVSKKRMSSRAKHPNRCAAWRNKQLKPRVEEPALSEGPARDRIERDLHFAQTHKACWDLGAPIVPPFLTRHAHIGQAHLVPRKRDYGESHGL